MAKHECGNNIVRNDRLLLAIFEGDQDAYTRTLDEIRGCTACLAESLMLALQPQAGCAIVTAGGRAEAIELYVDSLLRYLPTDEENQRYAT